MFSKTVMTRSLLSSTFALLITACGLPREEVQDAGSQVLAYGNLQLEFASPSETNANTSALSSASALAIPGRFRTAQKPTTQVFADQDYREIFIEFIGSPRTGQRFSLDGTHASATYNEAVLQAPERSWRTTGGELIIDKVTAEDVHFTLKGVTFQAETTTGAKGSFVVSGSGVVPTEQLSSP